MGREGEDQGPWGELCVAGGRQGGKEGFWSPSGHQHRACPVNPALPSKPQVGSQDQGWLLPWDFWFSPFRGPFTQGTGSAADRGAALLMETPNLPSHPPRYPAVLLLRYINMGSRIRLCFLKQSNSH